MKVLIAIDSSAKSNKVLDAVIHKVWTESTEFKILTVIEPTMSFEVQEEYVNQCKVILETRIRLFKKRLPHNKVFGELNLACVDKAILEAAQNWHTDLIILGSHGKTGIRSHAGINIEQTILANAQCPVEIIAIEPNSSNL